MHATSKRRRPGLGINSDKSGASQIGGSKQRLPLYREDWTLSW